MKSPLGRMVSILHRQSQIYITHALKDFSVTSSEYFFLFFLYQNQEGISQDELSRLLFIDKSATTRALKSLEQKNYILRKKNEDDKRFNKVYLTKNALTILPEMKRRVLAFSEFLTSDLDSDTETLLINTLNELAEKAKTKDLELLAKEISHETC